MNYTTNQFIKLLNVVFYTSGLLFAVGLTWKYILKKVLYALRTFKPSSSHTPSSFTTTSATSHSKQQQRNSSYEIYLPVPYIDLHKLFPSHLFTSPQFKVDYLNQIAKQIDFLHKNYIHYMNKVSTTSTANTNLNDPNQSSLSSKTTFQKRILPIMIKQKFQLGKTLLLRDLRDGIESTQLKIEMYRQQVKQLFKRIPPEFFILNQKFSPYYWILTDFDYKIMPPFLRNFILFTNTTNTNTLMDPLVNSTMGYNTLGNPYQFSSFGLNGNSYYPNRMTGSNYSNHTLDNNQMLNMILREFKIFFSSHQSLQHRFNFMFHSFIKKEGYIIEKSDLKTLKDEFRLKCYLLLKKRRRIAKKKIKTIRMRNIRPLEREKSQMVTQFNRLTNLSLQL
ncbi:hypothetical protein ABK040_008389 [Willaertia magna]